MYYSGYVSLAAYRLTGRPFREWYALYVDASANITDKQWLAETETSVGQMQVQFLQRQGLLPGHRLLDFGCGNLRGGIPLISYLDEACYVGVDISEVRLREGRSRVATHGLESKRPVLFHVHDLAMKELVDARFDYVWSMSVLAHMPLEDIEALFANISCRLNPGSVFLASYSDGADRDYRDSLKDWFHQYSTLAKIAQRHGFRCQLIDDWRHPDPRNPRERMLRLQLAETTSGQT